MENKSNKIMFQTDKIKDCAAATASVPHCIPQDSDDDEEIAVASSPSPLNRGECSQSQSRQSLRARFQNQTYEFQSRRKIYQRVRFHHLYLVIFLHLTFQIDRD